MSIGEDAWFTGDNLVRRHFQQAKHCMRFGQRNCCATEVRKAGAVVRYAAHHEKNPKLKTALTLSVTELERLAIFLENTDRDMNQGLSNVFARVESALARHYLVRIEESWDSGNFEETARTLRATLGHIEGAMQSLAHEASQRELRALIDGYSVAFNLSTTGSERVAIQRVEASLLAVISRLDEEINSLPKLSEPPTASLVSPHPHASVGYLLAEDEVLNMFLCSPQPTCREALNAAALGNCSLCQCRLRTVLRFLEMELDRAVDSSVASALSQSVHDVQQILHKLEQGESVPLRSLTDEFANLSWSLSRLYCDDARAAWAGGKHGHAARRLLAAERQLELSMSWCGVGFPMGEAEGLVSVEDACNESINRMPHDEEALHQSIAFLTRLIDSHRPNLVSKNDTTTAGTPLRTPAEQ